ncbi:hypothetical protein B1207_06005 [Legionella quinlivanii]|uniref:Uncharacterized protein n=1 Tax=Legionella quinlivanii TaxID=45073 RepID=A0A364LK90_9GAMM|nr:hypothetical protein B1207_06005 [Legionella quinlivanii]
MTYLGSYKNIVFFLLLSNVFFINEKINFFSSAILQIDQGKIISARNNSNPIQQKMEQPLLQFFHCSTLKLT